MRSWCPCWGRPGVTALAFDPTEMRLAGLSQNQTLRVFGFILFLIGAALFMAACRWQRRALARFREATTAPVSFARSPFARAAFAPSASTPPAFASAAATASTRLLPVVSAGRPWPPTGYEREPAAGYEGQARGAGPFGSAREYPVLRPTEHQRVLAGDENAPASRRYDWSRTDELPQVRGQPVALARPWR